MKDSDIDTLSADGAQEAPTTPQAALAEALDDVALPETLNLVWARLAAAGFVIVNVQEERQRRNDEYMRGYRAGSLMRDAAIGQGEPEKGKSPIVEVIGLGDGTMNVKTEDGMRWHLTEQEYRNWPRAAGGMPSADAAHSQPEDG